MDEWRMMFVNIEQATGLTGKSRATISRHIKSGKLSRTVDGIDTAELMRVYGALVSVPDKPVLQAKYEALSERETWLMAQIDSLSKQLLEQKAEHLEMEKRLMGLLEHKIEKKRFGLF
jgi:hypothetical protein